VTQQAVAELFDGEPPDRLRRDQIPGAVVSVVSGGATVFSNGYGMADIERDVPFSASTSLVRIASITKLFTWTAVMQQVEAGRLDLDADGRRGTTSTAHRSASGSCSPSRSSCWRWRSPRPPARSRAGAGSAAPVASRLYQAWLLTGTAAGLWFGWQWNLVGWWSV
jgi:hypothetical protein